MLEFIPDELMLAYVVFCSRPPLDPFVEAALRRVAQPDEVVNLFSLESRFEGQLRLMGNAEDTEFVMDAYLKYAFHESLTYAEAMALARVCRKIVHQSEARLW